MSKSSFVVHQDPVWREHSNFVINAYLPETDQTREFEQLFARQISDDRFELCCIPFFLFDMALGDIVRTAPTGGRQYVVTEVETPSGRYVFRAWFGESSYPRTEIEETLKAMGCLVEWSSRNLLAVDATDDAHAQTVADFLADQQKARHLLYETGRS
jgi:hypothetical protein